MWGKTSDCKVTIKREGSSADGKSEQQKSESHNSEVDSENVAFKEREENKNSKAEERPKRFRSVTEASMPVLPDSVTSFLFLKVLQVCPLI